jgi:hypothetical protein
VKLSPTNKNLRVDKSLQVDDSLLIQSLGGAGTLMMTVNNSGVVGAQAISGGVDLWTLTGDILSPAADSMNIVYEVGSIDLSNPLPSIFNSAYQFFGINMPVPLLGGDSGFVYQKIENGNSLYIQANPGQGFNINYLNLSGFQTNVKVDSTQIKLSYSIAGKIIDLVSDSDGVIQAYYKEDGYSYAVGIIDLALCAVGSFIYRPNGTKLIATTMTKEAGWVVKNETDDFLRVDTFGNFTVGSLATGGADEMVVSDSFGVLSTQAIPGGGTGFTIDGNNNMFTSPSLDNCSGCANNFIVTNGITDITSGGDNTLVGLNTNIATGSHSSTTVLGNNSSGGEKSVSIGNATTSNNRSVSVGYKAFSNDMSIAVGDSASSSGTNNISIGRLAISDAGSYSIAFGVNTNTSNNNCINSIAFGTNAIATASNQFFISDSITEMSIAADIDLRGAAGTKIGTATSQKLAFYNQTPVDRPDAVGDPSGGVIQDAESRTAIIAIIDRLIELGLIAP